jgi:hypothetical protein
MLVFLVGGIYESHHCDGVGSHEDWINHSKVNRGDTRMDTQTGKLSHKHISFSKIRKVG